LSRNKVNRKSSSNRQKDIDKVHSIGYDVYARNFLQQNRREGKEVWKKAKEFLKRQGILSWMSLIVSVIALLKVLLFE